MSNLIVEPFSVYGNAATTDDTTIQTNMRAGVWSQVGSLTTLSLLPWYARDTDLYFVTNSNRGLARRALAAGAVDPFIVSVRFAVDSLPATNDVASIIDFRDTANTVMANLFLTSTGVVQLCNGAGAVLVASSSPVLVAQSVAHLEMKFVKSTGAFTLKVNETQVIAATGLTFSTSVSNVAQFALGNGQPGPGNVGQYYTGLICRDTNGSVNNDFRGDRRVATYFVASDDPAN